VRVGRVDAFTHLPRGVSRSGTGTPVGRGFAAGVLACLAWPVAALATDESPHPPDDPNNLGLAIAREPDYEGSAHRRVDVVPIVNVNFQYDAGTLTLGGDGVGQPNTTPLVAWSTPGAPYALSALVDYDGGRRDDRSGSALRSGSARLRGLGDLAGTFEYGLAASYDIGVFSAALGYRQAPNGHGHAGARVDLGIDVTLPVDERLAFVITPAATWASTRFMRSYFGVDTDQAARSVFRPYPVGAGLKNYGLTLAGSYAFLRHWSAIVEVAATRLGPRAADSPIVERVVSVIPTAGVACRW